MSYECRVSYDEFWAAVGGDVVEMVRETLEEARLGILTADERWLVEGLSATGGSLADQVRAKPEFAIRVAIECSPQELLLGLFDERSLPKPGYIANNVLAIATAGNDVVFSGEAFVARPPK